MTTDEQPAYGTTGWVLVEILGKGASSVYHYEIEEYSVDTSASTFWIIEGVGIDFWLDQYAPNDLSPGWWVFEDVVGTYIRDDEEWEYAKVRPATQQEIDTLSVTRTRT